MRARVIEINRFMSPQLYGDMIGDVLKTCLQQLRDEQVTVQLSVVSSLSAPQKNP